MIVLKVCESIDEPVVIRLIDHPQVPLLMPMVFLGFGKADRQQIMGGDFPHRMRLHLLHPGIFRVVVVANAVLHTPQADKLSLGEEGLALNALPILGYGFLEPPLAEQEIAPLPMRQ